MEESLNKYSKWKWILHSTYILSVYIFLLIQTGVPAAKCLYLFTIKE